MTRIGETRRACWVLGEKHERLLGWEDNIKTDLEELGWDNMEVNLHVAYTAGNFPNR